MADQTFGLIFVIVLVVHILVQIHRKYNKLLFKSKKVKS